MSNNRCSALILAITGGIACGKSEVGRIAAEMGFEVYDADRIAHALMEKGSSVYERVLKHFGPRILSKTGGISRPVLGEIVFGDPAELEVLNSLVHPAVREALRALIVKHRASGRNAAMQVPLLFETGMDGLNWDAVVCVSSRQDTICSRLEKRGLSRTQALERIGAQMVVIEKVNRSDVTIENETSLAELECTTRRVIEGLL